MATDRDTSAEEGHGNLANLLKLMSEASLDEQKEVFCHALEDQTTIRKKGRKEKEEREIRI